MKNSLKCFFLSLMGGGLGVILGFIIGGMAMYYYVANFSPYAQKPNVRNVNTALLGIENPTSDKEKGLGDNVEQKAKVGVDFYLCEITDFYENLITILFSTIGITLVIGFLYVYNASKRRADDMARNALDEESFVIKLDKRIDKAVAKISTQSGIPEMIEEIEYMNQMGKEGIMDRIEVLEKEITKFSYQASHDVISEEPREEKT